MSATALSDRFRIRVLYEDVARQHALLDRLLPRDLRAASSLAYLLYRMLDVLEDAPLPTEAALTRLDAAAEDLLLGIGSARRLILETPGLPPRWRALFENWDLIRAAFEARPEEERRAVEETGRFMAHGMARWKRAADAASAAGRDHFLPDLPALEDYCQAVAGCVGELHTTLFLQAGAFSEGTNAAEAMKGGAMLGRYLQLVNVIRDEAEERAVRKRSFFPASLAPLEPAARLEALLAHARGLEPAIDAYRATIKPGPVRDYVAVLLAVARLHFAHYATHPEVMTAPTKPPAISLWRILPWNLRARLVAYKLGF